MAPNGPALGRGATPREAAVDRQVASAALTVVTLGSGVGKQRSGAWIRTGRGKNATNEPHTGHNVAGQFSKAFLLLVRVRV